MTKYLSLSPDKQKEVDDFVDMILSKEGKPKAFDMKKYRAKIKDISTWTEADIKIFEENRVHFSDWKPEVW